MKSAESPKTESRYLRPATAKEAVETAARCSGKFAYLAGGTDLMVNIRQGNAAPACLIDISELAELRGISKEKNFLRIGSLTTLEELTASAVIEQYIPALADAARAVGSPTVRRMGTLGGNLLCENRCSYYNQSEFWRDAADFCLKSGGEFCIATGGTRKCFSEFVSDTAPVLIAAEAQVGVADAGAARHMAIEELYSGDGIQPRRLSATALLTEIRIPLTSPLRIVFKKLRPRAGVDFTSLTMAASLKENGLLRIVVGGVSPAPVVVSRESEAPREELLRDLLKQCKTVDNDVFSRNYRREMLGVFLNQSLNELGSPAEQSVKGDG